jgi:hypothetical protein
LLRETPDLLDLLEVQRFDQCEELVLGVFDGVIDEPVGEEDRVVSHLDLVDCFADADFELLLRLDSISDPAAQLLETRRVNEQEVALKRLFVDLNGALDIDLDDGDLASRLDALELGQTRTVPAALTLLSTLDELTRLPHALELGDRHEVEVFLRFLVVRPDRPRRVRLLSVEDVPILLEDQIDQCSLADARGTHQNQRLVLERRRVERVKVLLRVHENIVLRCTTKKVSELVLLYCNFGLGVRTYWLREKNRAEEIVEDFSDLWVLGDILVVLLHELVFARREVRQHLVVEVHVLLHFDNRS